ncbi:hypothetical protein BJY59DRAFT_431337 [Rhodotorula toruloides]
MSAIFNSIDTAQRSQEGTGAAGEATGRGQSRRGTGSGEDEEGEGASRGRGKGQRAPLAKQACVRCRTIKVRCQPQEPGNGRCVRCTRLKFDCEWVEPQKRGRRVGSSRTSQDSSSTSASANATRRSTASHFSPRPLRQLPVQLSVNPATHSLRPNSTNLLLRPRSNRTFRLLPRQQLSFPNLPSSSSRCKPDSRPTLLPS